MRCASQERGDLSLSKELLNVKVKPLFKSSLLIHFLIIFIKKVLVRNRSSPYRWG